MFPTYAGTTEHWLSACVCEMRERNGKRGVDATTMKVLQLNQQATDNCHKGNRSGASASDPTVSLLLAPLANMRYGWFGLLFVLFGGHVTDAEEEVPPPQCTVLNEDGTCANEPEYTEKCGLYMAESSIPNAGWGMYSNRDRIDKGQPILPLDVVIQVYDIPNHLDAAGPTQWVLAQYVWNSDMTKSQFDAEDVHSIVPGIGMLANSHPGLVNCHNEGALNRRPWTNRSHPVTGSFTHYQDLAFTATAPISKGEEIFDEYGDSWFEGRERVFGKIPLSRDYHDADIILERFATAMNGSASLFDTPMAEDLWTLSLELLDAISEDEDCQRLINALPKSSKQAGEWLALYPEGDRISARGSVPNFIRSEEWLEANGMCLDNIAIQDAGDKGNGAFATRFLPRGTLVAPTPVVHLRRKDMDIIWEESYDPKHPDDTRILWKGDQLLLNYCYGNPMSSLLFFPYSPAVNVINHGRPANVALRWSNHSNAEMMEWSTRKVFAQNMKAGLMMELYALTDIAPGDEILLDYGDDWQHSWDIHKATYIPPVHKEDYKVAWDYDNADMLYANNETKYPPPYIESRCWADYDEQSGDENGFFIYQDPNESHLDYTVPCTVIGKEDTENGIFYMIKYYDEEDEEELKIKGVPYEAIVYFDRAYTGNQFLRNGFRHFIELPDEMIPANWRDMGMDVEDNSECGLYMAESSIPHSGLGMYTAREVNENERIGFGDVTVQVEDIIENARLRLLYNGLGRQEEKEWLLEHYYWTAESTMAQFDADFIESMVPGFGMLANSHTGLYNAAMRSPQQRTDLFRGLDPGSGASTTYHDVHYVAGKSLAAGEEIFVEYGDNYFVTHDFLSFVPLSSDFSSADKFLKQFATLVEDDLESELASDLFDVASTAYLSSNTRFANAIPRTLEDFSTALEDGSEEVNIPNRIKSADWLKENGMCIDNIMPMKSRIIQAGRGAFATRRIKKGEIISPVPLVQVRRDHLDIYEADESEDPDKIRHVGKQIILNYCFGHPESSVLLFPYAPVVNYVNHHSTKTNSKVRWSHHSSHSSQMLNMDPQNLTDLERTGLMMDLIATTDIEVGEEIYMNYGYDWERAWNTHMAEWTPSHDDESYISASVLNKHVEWLRTTDELEENPYPSNIFTGCMVQRSLSRSQQAGGKTQQWRYFDELLVDGTYMRECQVISRTTLADPIEIEHDRDSFSPPLVTYTVSVQFSHDGPFEIVTGVPRTAIVFLDRSYTNDQYNRKAFRHEMVLPEDMVPAVWRDLK